MCQLWEPLEGKKARLDSVWNVMQRTLFSGRGHSFFPLCGIISPYNKDSVSSQRGCSNMAPPSGRIVPHTQVLLKVW